MTKHDLKELAAMGAELGAAKAEVERLLVLLRDVNDVFEGQHPAPGLVIARVRNTLSQHAEPTDTYTAVDMATAAAQGFRDGQAAVEQAAAQTAPQKYDDVLLPFLSMMRAELHANAGKGDRPGWLAMDVKTALLEIFYHIGKLQKAAKKGDRDGIREYSADVANMSMMLADICGVLPEYQAQTAPQPEQSRPANKLRALAEIWDQNADEADEFGNAQAAEALRLAAFELRAALSAQGAAKFRMGDLVKKSTGSEWIGRVVGWYSTEQTKEGYAVESSAHRNSVQIYPAKALELVPMAAKEA
jgi:hypothetical protein